MRITKKAARARCEALLGRSVRIEQLLNGPRRRNALGVPASWALHIEDAEGFLKPEGCYYTLRDLVARCEQLAGGAK